MFRRTKLKLNDLSQTGGVKDFNYICITKFWRDGAIVEFFTTKRRRTNGFTTNHPCMKHFLNQVTPLLRKEATSLAS